MNRIVPVWKINLDGLFFLGIYDDVAPMTDEERKSYETIDFDVTEFRDSVGAKRLPIEDKSKLLQRRWREPRWWNFPREIFRTQLLEIILVWLYTALKGRSTERGRKPSFRRKSSGNSRSESSQIWTQRRYATIHDDEKDFRYLGQLFGHFIPQRRLEEARIA